MENPFVLVFLVGLLLGLMMGMYLGSKKFRLTINAMIKGKDKDTGDDEDAGDEDVRYEDHNRRYGDGPYRNSDRTTRQGK